MRIRYARREDLGFILGGLEDNRSLEGRPKRSPEARESVARAFETEIDEGRVRIAEDDEAPVAFLCFKLDFPVMYVTGKFLWIDLVYVRAGSRGRGLGKLLYEDAIELARENGCTKVAADVFAANTGSIEFHHSVGFEPLYTIFQREV
jgi:GNAT superfamily N-acetyltransferase